MLKVTDLVKVYKSKKGKEVRALDSISFSLPNKGLVFIVGKSGSGKSTFLNLLGGLDTPTNGEIEVLGNKLSSFSNDDFEKYRNTVIGFVFQDYLLINELTVEENIKLLNSDLNDEELDTLLEQCEIKEYKYSYPQELSGGQQQRVAIARAISKKPKLLICDEPTGNLDSKTTRKIINIIKEVSKDILVVVVSHNLQQAQEYGDRIIELSEGKIISDITKVENYDDSYKNENGVITIPHNSELSEENIADLNESIAKGKVKSIKQNKGGFTSKNGQIYEENEVFDIKSQKKHKQSSPRIFSKFFTTKKLSSLLIVIVTGIIFSIFSIAQSYNSFLPHQMALSVQQTLYPEYYVLEKRDGSTMLQYTDKELERFSKTIDYQQFKNVVIRPDVSGSAYDCMRRYNQISNLSNFYMRESPGTLICSEQYLTNVYKQNDGKLKVLAGSLEDCKTTSKVIITDYLADSFIYWSNRNELHTINSYQDLIDNPIVDTYDSHWGQVGAIIRTNYKYKYQEVKEFFLRIIANDITLEEIRHELKYNSSIASFINETESHLGVAYSLNPDFVDGENRDFSRFGDFELVNGDKRFSIGNSAVNRESQAIKYSITGNDIYMPVDTYNTLFTKTYTQDDVFKDLGDLGTFTVNRYLDNDITKEIIYTHEFNVKGLTYNEYITSIEMNREIRDLNLGTTRLYVTHVKDVNGLVGIMSEEDTLFRYVYSEGNKVDGMAESVNAFQKLFVILQVALVLAIVIYLAGYVISNIRRNYYQIGVIKACGGNTSTINKIFIGKSLIIGVITCVFSYIASIIMLNVANNVLVNSIFKVTEIANRTNLVIIGINHLMLGIDILVLLGITVIASFSNLIALHFVDPIKIIKKND